MTAAVPERTVEALWDQELEAVLDSEATCVADGNPATHIVAHAGKCASLICTEHAERITQQKRPSRTQILFCAHCGERPVAPASIEIRAV